MKENTNTIFIWCNQGDTTILEKFLKDNESENNIKYIIDLSGNNNINDISAFKNAHTLNITNTNVSDVSMLEKCSFLYK